MESAPLDTAGLVAELRRYAQHDGHSTDAHVAMCAAIHRAADALTAKDSDLAESRARDDAAAYDLVAGWHERQAKLFREMADDEPRTAAPARKRATEAAIHHAASAAALRNRAADVRRAALVSGSREERDG